MSKIGVLIETSGNEVKAANYGVITAARGKGGHEIYGFTMNADIAADPLKKYGVQKLVTVKAENGDPSTSPDLAAGALADAMKNFGVDYLFSLSSPDGRDILARIAAITGAPLALDCIGADPDERTVRKSHFAGKTTATLKLNGDLFLCGIRPNSVEEKEEPCEIEILDYSSGAEDPGKLKIKEVKKSDSKKIDLTEANIIITGGRPIGSAENYKMLDECAEALGAAVGASRASVDAGFAPHSMQVGQTGKTVSPKLYIGCGLSGSVQHFAGMKTSKVIVAINTDKDAPIFNKCDYGIIADMFDVVPVLTEVLKG